MPLQSLEFSVVAPRKKYFGKGAERIVTKFRVLDAHGNSAEPQLVANESRFKGDLGASDLRAFHMVSCMTQSAAKALAAVLNQRLSKIPAVAASTPRIGLIDCSAYKVHDVIQVKSLCSRKNNWAI